MQAFTPNVAPGDRIPGPPVAEEAPHAAAFARRTRTILSSPSRTNSVVEHPDFGSMSLEVLTYVFRG